MAPFTAKSKPSPALPEEQKDSLLTGHRYGIGAMCCSSTASTVATASRKLWDFGIRLWNYEKNEFSRALQGHRDKIGQLSSCRGQPLLLSSSDDMCVRFWDERCDASQAMRNLLQPTAACISESGEWMAASVGNDAFVYDVRCFDGPAVLHLHMPSISSDGGLLRDSIPKGSAMSPDANFFAVAYSNRIVCFNLHTSSVSCIYRCPRGDAFNGVSFCSRGMFLLVPTQRQGVWTCPVVDTALAQIQSQGHPLDLMDISLLTAQEDAVGIVCQHAVQLKPPCPSGCDISVPVAKMCPHSFLVATGGRLCSLWCPKL
jgi:WD40 repeat protein